MAEYQQLDWPEFLEISATETPITARLSSDSRALLFTALSLLESAHAWRGASGQVTSAEFDAIEALVAKAERELMVTSMIGVIVPFAGATLPADILPCDGSQYLRADYPDLYDILPAIYQVDADNFQTPDMRGRTVIGSGAGAFLPNYTLGQLGGQNVVSLTVAQLPVHNHPDAGHLHFRPNSPGITIAVVSPGEAFALAPNILPGETTVASANNASAGSGQGHENMQPYQAWQYGIIAR